MHDPITCIHQQERPRPERALRIAGTVAALSEKRSLLVTGNTMDWEAPEMATVQIAKTTAKVWEPPQ